VQVVPDLRSILGDTPWVLVGGLALRAFMPERMTPVVDILIHERDTNTAREAFLRAGYRQIGTLTIGGFTVQAAGASEPPVDVLTRDDAWLDSALAVPTADPAGLPVLARPYLVLLKLQAGRTQDLADVQRLLARTPSSERAEIRGLVQLEQPELTEDFDSLCTLADLEFGPPESNSQQ